MKLFAHGKTIFTVQKVDIKRCKFFLALLFIKYWSKKKDKKKYVNEYTREQRFKSITRII